MGSGVLSPEQAGELASACLDNARSLAADARTLVENGSYASATAWGVLASEEYGKALLCFSAITLQPNDTKAWQDFWQRWRTHPSKLELAAGQLIDLVVAGLPADRTDDTWRLAYDELTTHVKDINRRKQAAIYVDWHDGQVVSPLVDESEARALVEQVSAVIQAGSELWDGQDLAAIWGRIAPATRDFADELNAARHDGDSERAFAALEKLLRNQTPPDTDVDGVIAELRGRWTAAHND